MNMSVLVKNSDHCYGYWQAEPDGCPWPVNRVQIESVGEDDLMGVGFGDDEA